jgi:hypothetical protein
VSLNIAPGATVSDDTVSTQPNVASYQPAMGLPDGAALDGEPDPAVVRRLEDLTRVIDAAAEVWDETVIATWLRSNNDHLGGGRPIDALAVYGPDPVLAALDAEAEGVFA